MLEIVTVPSSVSRRPVSEQPIATVFRASRSRASRSEPVAQSQFDELDCNSYPL